MAAKPRILLIESEALREWYQFNLRSRFDVAACSGHYDSLIKFGMMRFDLILIDKRRAFGLISTLRKQHPGTPIMVMGTRGKHQEDDEIKADIFLQTPFDVGDLVLTLVKLFREKVI